MLFQIADDLADGDYPCPDRPALCAAAEQSRRSAAAALRTVFESDALAALRSLPDLILSPSHA
jgi:hypothetical protein